MRRDFLSGAERRFGGVRDAEESGIASSFKCFSLVKDLTIGENIFSSAARPRRFGVHPLDELYSQAQKLLTDLHLEIDAPHTGSEPRHRTAAVG